MILAQPISHLIPKAPINSPYFHSRVRKGRTGIKSREFLRWVRGWTRGYGHSFEVCGSCIVCPDCGTFFMIPNRHKEQQTCDENGKLHKRKLHWLVSPTSLLKSIQRLIVRRERAGWPDACGDCKSVIIRKVMES